MARPSKQQVNDELVLEVRNFFNDREGAESENRTQMAADLRFAYVPGAQWDEQAKLKRQGRPCYSYNRTVGAINQVVGDQRMTKPSGKVRAVNKAASAKTAEVFGGLIRDIEACSMADSIYDEAFKYGVAGGWGVWRVVPEYADDESFDQVLRIKRVPNPLTVYFDEHADPFGRGAMRCIVAERVSREKYEALYGKLEPYTNIDVPRDSKGWFSDREVRIAEYYKRTARTKTIAQLSDGRTEEWSKELEAEIEELNARTGGDLAVVNKRTVKKWYVKWWKVDGRRILEGPIEYEYQHIPVVRLPGRYINIEGEQLYQSLIRHAKDAARTYNYNRSNMVETVALTPRAPWLVTGKMITGYEAEWARANVSNAPYLRYNVDPDAPAMKPERNNGPEVPQAYIALAAHDAEDIRHTTGYINPAMMQPTNAGDAESGLALRTRLTAGGSESYEFLDNFAKAIKYTWEICIDMIPVTYDTPRTARILGMDGREAFEEIDPAALKQGKYDVTVTLGPSYATARMEALDTLLDASERMPIISEVAPDVVVKNLDVQGSDEIEKRIRIRLVQQGLIAPTEEDQKAIAELPQAPPDPIQTAMEARLQAQTARDAANAQKVQVETAEKMASAESAERRESLELRKMVADIAQAQAETMKILKELRQPAQTTT